ncbi:hypothetical protein R3P38DRAFT_3174100 [Favolaschia claudopus]|uniref:Bacteriophage T5 Orf172 DNA-binding domain-containing protein n=1 Tax=Favolaschia claudopus TaxID=2862362 RepID=A0AAW0DJA4_9AGAR
MRRDADAYKRTQRAHRPDTHIHPPTNAHTRLSLNRVVPPSQRAHSTDTPTHTTVDTRLSRSPIPFMNTNTARRARLPRARRARLRRDRLARLDRDLPDQSTLYNKIYRRRDLHSAIAKPPSRSDRPGVVYWLKMVHKSGLVEWKAGCTDNMQRRLRQWRRQCRGCHITVVDYVRTRYAKKLERCLHLYLKISDLWKKPCACEACRVHHREKFEIGRLRGGIGKALSVTRLLRDLVDS